MAKKIIDKLEDLERKCDAAFKKAIKLTLELDKERAAHLDTLRRVEWGASGDYQDNDGVIRLRPCCPECMCWKHDGWHEDDCKLAADLKRLEGLLK